MPKEEIIDGLKYAVSKGDTLEKAMMSFFNAGYSKDEIEEAARFLNSPQTPGNFQSQQATQGGVVQRVSQYGKPSSSGKTVTMILIFLLIFLVGILITVFLFREEISEFLSNIVG
ncbi:MAG: hypothetical protein WDZ62_01545 [Candidatus Pacearchaeota archaeon]